jgi:ABC-2 type transport system ATP-binding protein
MAGFAVETRELRKAFGREQALSGGVLQAAQGQFTCLLGGTESGKSTLVRCLLGQYSASGGSASVLGMDTATQSMAIRRAVGYAPQGDFFDPTLSVQTTVRFAGSFRLSEDALTQAVERALADVRYSGKEKQKLRKLQAGPRTRVALAIAIVGDPSLIVLDSIGENLDPLDREELFDMLRGWQQRTGATVLYTSRLTEDAEHAHSIAFLIGGRVVEQREVSAIRQQSAFSDDSRRAIEAHFKSLLEANREKSA